MHNDYFSTISEAFYRDLIDRLPEGRIELPEMPLSAAALTAQQLHQRLNRHILCITEGPARLAELHSCIRMIADERQHVLYFPAAHRIAQTARKTSPVSEDLAIAGHRINALSFLSRCPTPCIITTSIQAIMQKLPPPEQLACSSMEIKSGALLDRDHLTAALHKMRYEFTEEVLEPGSVSVRGCILDIWPSSLPEPVRIETFDQVVESIRRFDPADQRSLGRMDKITISPPTEAGAGAAGSVSLVSYLQADPVVFWINSAAVAQHAGLFESTCLRSDSLLDLEEIRREIKQHTAAVEIASDTEHAGSESFDIVPAASLLGLPSASVHADAFEETRKKAGATAEELLNNGFRLVISSSSEGTLGHFFGSSLSGRPGVHFHKGPLSSGFGSDKYKFLVISENDLLPSKRISPMRYSPFGDEAASPSRWGFRPAEITDIEPGNLVVHADHGIGIYRGINEITVADQLQEVLTLEYADKMMLHVPVSQAHLLSRYIGLPNHKAALHRLGGRRWSREKENAGKSIVDMAGSLLELQAHRAVQPGYAFSGDKPWQVDFESSFQYQETGDQLKAIAAAKKDMETPHPMDRLICGDAGYGKTEVAMRCAFKAVMDHRQVAVLVPTTVLAQQHFDTFNERMAPYPVSICMLSRFCSKSRRNGILKGLSDGTIDIVIGTHSLLQPNVTFKELGLVIIDEEQRFGVEHKERLKQMRKLVDVLTMTATPIPRTLYMSMTGAREMSLIQTPPNERLPVQTIVAKNSDETVRTAILNELNREGQVFYLHNRIISIDRVHKRLTELVPEARISVAHGRMPAMELSEAMHAFARGNTDILLCTTIIESGLDIPRANTILIDRADRFGIADLYQLRGRVGRSTRKAYAYLLLPAHGYIDSDAKTRISAVKTYSGLATGFNLALRDMEIRGVGNILGAEQSGHISAIGFGLYCQLLKRTVQQLKGEPAPPPVTCRLKLDFISFTFHESGSAVAAIPHTYVEEERIRLGIYRKIAEAASASEVDELNEEIADRFGPLHPCVKRLICVTRIRIESSLRSIEEIETRGDRLMMLRNGDYIKQGRLFPRMSSTDPDQKLMEIINAVSSI